MLSSLKKMRGDKKGWYKVSDLRPGLEIAVPSKTGNVLWDEIVSIKPVGREKVYDIEVEGTHNFVGNDLFAHNTAVLKANAAFTVQGELNAADVIVPTSAFVALETANGVASTTPPVEVLTADGSGVSLFKLATSNLNTIQSLLANVAGVVTRLTSLEERVEKIESGAVSSASGSPISLSTSTLANALSGFGVLIEKGIAQFNTLVFRQLVASSDADGTSSAGSVSILTGNTVAQVNNSLVAASTKVFVTFNSQITGSWWVSDKTAGSFRVVLSDPQTADVSFDYFLVQTEGQLATSTSSTQTTSDVTQSSGPDTVAPVITVIGDNPLHLSGGSTCTEPGVTVVDAVDGTDPVVTYINGMQQEANASTIDTTSPTTYIITYQATDAAGNMSTATRSVIVGNPDGTVSSEQQAGAGSSDPTDSTPPVVTLVGDAALELTLGDTFTDPGATAADETDGDLTSAVVVTGSVDTATEGLYTLTYTATDAAGNVGSVSRVVTVVAPAAP